MIKVLILHFGYVECSQFGSIPFCLNEDSEGFASPKEALVDLAHDLLDQFWLNEGYVRRCECGHDIQPTLDMDRFEQFLMKLPSYSVQEMDDPERWDPWICSKVLFQMYKLDEIVEVRSNAEFWLMAALDPARLKAPLREAVEEWFTDREIDWDDLKGQLS